MKDWRSIGLLTQLGWVFAFAVLLPLGIGIWLDHTLHKSPVFFLIGALLGILAGTIGAVRIATRAIQDVEQMHAPKTDEAVQKEDQA